MSAALNVTNDSFAAEVEQANVPVVVDFWAEWCGPCKMLGPVLDEIAAEKGDSAKVVKVNIDSERDLAVRFGVSSIPTLVFFKDGQAQGQIVGVQPKSAIVQKLDALA